MKKKISLFKYLILILLLFLFSISKISAIQDISSLKILKDNFVKEIFDYKYKALLSHPKGALNKNVLFEQGKNSEWNIREQKYLYIFIMKGISETDTQLIEQGINAMEYGLEHQTKEGIYPNSSWYEIEQFTTSSLYSLLLLRESSYSIRYNEKINVLIKKLPSSFFYLKENFNKEIFPLITSSKEFSSHVLSSAALNFYLWGKETNNNLLIENSQNIITFLNDNQRNDGVLLEKDSYDSYFQIRTLLNLMIYFLNSDNEAINKKIYSILQKGWQWQLSQIKNNGEVKLLGNTYTGLKFAKQRFIFNPVNYSDISLAIVYWSYISNNNSLIPTAKKVFNYGLVTYGENAEEP